MSIEKWRELYHERAAIIEVEVKIPRQQAEEKARNQITDLWLQKTGLSLDEGKTYIMIAKFKKELMKC